MKKQMFLLLLLAIYLPSNIAAKLPRVRRSGSGSNTKYLAGGLVLTALGYGITHGIARYQLKKAKDEYEFERKEIEKRKEIKHGEGKSREEVTEERKKLLRKRYKDNIEPCIGPKHRKKRESERWYKFWSKFPEKYKLHPNVYYHYCLNKTINTLGGIRQRLSLWGWKKLSQENYNVKKDLVRLREMVESGDKYSKAKREFIQEQKTK